MVNSHFKLKDMKKYLLLFLISITTSTICVAQSYTEKYNSLYNRYEYYDSNGKLIGYKKWNSLYNRYDIEYLGNNNSSQYNNYNYVQPYDFELMYKALEYKQNRYDNNIQKVQNKANYINKLFEFFTNNIGEREISNRIQELSELLEDYSKKIKEIENARLDYSSSSNTNQVLNIFSYYETELKRIAKDVENERKSTINRMNQIISFYNSFSSYPTKIKDGWHMVHSMNNKDFCEERKVYVQNNKVTKYVIDDWDKMDIQYSNSISSGKTRVKLVGNDDFLDLYFLDYLNNPNKTVTSPQSSGKVSFWKDFTGGGYVKIWVEENYIGEIKHYFDSGTPSCSQNGTVVYEGKPGTYNYVAKNNELTWKGSFTISANDCKNQKLKDADKGRVSFWSNYKRARKISIYINGKFVGNINDFFKKDKPYCGQNGTLTVTHNVGTYSYEARSAKGHSWKGKITITKNGCSLQGLVK